MNVRSTILSTITEVAAEHGKTLAPLDDALKLLDSGLDSLCLAVIVVRLEDRLGVDPFSSEKIIFPVTIGDFLQLYATAVG
jgi:acyl carrier protein